MLEQQRAEYMSDLPLAKKIKFYQRIGLLENL
jgi:hypothetical protein